MAHEHGHGHHHHELPADVRAGPLGAALGLIVALMVGEVVVAVLTGSLALLSDAAHMLTDAAAIALSLVAARLARRPAGGALTFGLRRAEILSAQANGLTLLVLALVIVAEGVRRLVSPADVDAGPVLAVALVAIPINLVAAALIARAGRQSLNVEGSYQHVVTDLYAFLGTAVAAVVILTTGFDRADAIASLFVAALMLRSAYALLRASGRIFLEAAPEGMDPETVGRAMVAVPGVVEIHDLHVWEVTSGFAALSAHVLVGPDADCHAARRDVEAVLQEAFGLHHTTLQVDHESRDDLLEIRRAR